MGAQQKGKPKARRLRTAREKRTTIESLERRTLLASALSSGLPIILDSVNEELTFSNLFPSQKSLWTNDQTLSPAQKGDALEIALNYLQENAGSLGLNAADVASPLVTDQYTDDLTGVTHIYLQQQVNNLPVINTSLTVNVLSDGSILSVGGGFVPGIPSLAKSAPTPLLAPSLAANVAGQQLRLITSSRNLLVAASASASTADRLTNLQSSTLSLDPIPARLVYVPTSTGVELAWNMVMRTPDGEHWYDVAVGDQAGRVVFANDWVDHATYDVIPAPSESPNDGPSFPNRQLLVDPHDTLASPFGWHDTNGVAGPEFTDTRGNNVSAQEDANANNTGGFRPDGGVSLNFDFPLDLSQAPSTYQSAAITNLFYWNNVLHDVHYKYGFTETAGNFQTNNYGRGGSASDAVQADAQDGSGTNNANFATPPDGSAPRMQMYLFNSSVPSRDGDLDNGIIIHEYGHGVSTRLTGGPANSNSLNSTQSAGMGEGWSDWWALMLMQQANDTANDANPMGTYALGQPMTGAGIRRKPYSFNMAINPLTIDAYGTSGTSSGVTRSTESHNAGELWCSALWDMTWLLIGKHGFSPNIAAGYDPGSGNDKGNQLALRLVMDALKLQPANPSFKQARDAILQADQVLTGGANQTQIWQAFARRGMGFSFATSGATSTTVTAAFDLPIADPVVTSTSIAAGVTVQTPISYIDFNFSEPMNTSSFSIADDVVRFSGPANVDLRSTITSFSWLDSDTLRINFATLSQFSGCTLEIGPGILANDNQNPMDQDRDATPGESTDRFAAIGYAAVSTSFENINLVPGGAGVTSILDGYDDSTTAINLGSNTFNFYGTTYSGSQLYASTNGLVSFATSVATFTNNTLTSTPAPATIAPYWDDWITNKTNSASGANNDLVLYKFEDANSDTVMDRLIIEWNSVYHVTSQASPVTFQLILYLNTGATPGRFVFNYVDLDVGASASNFGNSQTEGFKDANTQGLSRLLIASNATNALVGSGKAILLAPDVEAPAIVSQQFDYDATPQAIRLTFNEDLAAPLTLNDLVLANLDTSVAVLPQDLTFSYDAQTRTATLTFPGFPGGILPDANYRLTISANAITDRTGNRMATDQSFDFFSLAGDANHDRMVDIHDLAILAGNWQTSPRLFSEADFNQDGSIDAFDLAILSANWQKVLP